MVFSIIIIIIIIIIICEFFHTSVGWCSFTGVPSSFQDSSQYSGKSEQCCCLNGLDLSLDFQLPPLPSLLRLFQAHQF